MTFSKYKARVIPLSFVLARCSGCSKRLSKNSFGGSLSPLVPLKLELCSIDEKAQSVAVSNIVTSASLADSSDVSYVWAIISRVIVLRCTCSTSSISPSENKDSLCFDLRLFSLRPSCGVSHYDRLYLFQMLLVAYSLSCETISQSLLSMERQSSCYAWPSWKGSV